MPLSTFAYYFASLLFLIADAIQKKTSASGLTWSYLAKRSFYTSLVSIVATVFLYGFRTFPSPVIAFQMAGCSVCCGLGLFYYIRAINSLNFSNVGSLEIVGNVLKQLSGMLLFHEKVGKLDIASFILMSFGCIYQLLFTTSLRGAKYVLLSSFFWTTGYILLSYVLKSTPTVYWSVPIMEVTILLMSLLLLVFYKQNRTLSDFSLWPVDKNVGLFLAIGLFIYGASLLNNYAFQQLPLTTINVFQLSMMPIGYVLSMRLFRERPTIIEIVSFCTGFAGFALFIYAHH